VSNSIESDKDAPLGGKEQSLGHCCWCCEITKEALVRFSLNNNYVLDDLLTVICSLFVAMFQEKHDINGTSSHRSESHVRV